MKKKRKYCKNKIIFTLMFVLFFIYLLFYIFFNNTYTNGYNITTSDEGVLLKKSEEILDTNTMVYI